MDDPGANFESSKGFWETFGGRHKVTINRQVTHKIVPWKKGDQGVKTDPFGI